MNNLLSIIYYICYNYPNKDDLSNARLNKIIYLADWRNILRNQRQISDISWVFNHYGPFVNDIINVVKDNPDTFSIKCDENAYGKPKQIIYLNNYDNSQNLLSIDDNESIDFVMEKTCNMGFNQFIQYVYSTYPVLSSQHGDKLDLEAKAAEYRSNKQVS